MDNPTYQPVNIVVPAAEHLKTIEAGSGIVQDVNNPNIIYYEGNLYGADNIKTFADRIYMAWGRMIQNYPTIAKQAVTSEQIQIVGVFDPTFGVVTVTNEQALQNWLGTKDLEQQLQTTNPKHQDLRTVQNWNPVQRQTVLKTLPKNMQQKYKNAGLL